MKRSFLDVEIDEMAQSLDMGLQCLIHKETGVIHSQVLSLEQLEESGLTLDDISPEERDILENPTNYHEIEKMPSSEAFSIMQDFAFSVSNKRLQDRLFQALERRKPFSNFKRIIDNSSVRENWFAFKGERYFNYVKKELEWIYREED